MSYYPSPPASNRPSYPTPPGPPGQPSASNRVVPRAPSGAAYYGVPSPAQLPVQPPAQPVRPPVAVPVQPPAPAGAWAPASHQQPNWGSSSSGGGWGAAPPQSVSSPSGAWGSPAAPSNSWNTPQPAAPPAGPQWGQQPAAATWSPPQANDWFASALNAAAVSAAVGGGDAGKIMANAIGGALDAHKGKSMPWFESKIEFLREYFNVTHAYVRWRLLFVLLPLMQNPNQMVSRATSREVPQDEDEPTGQGNGIGLRLFPGRRPDLYIPTMGYLTFVLAHSLSKGTDFHPDDLYNIATLALLLGAVEVLIVKGAAYILNVPTYTLTDIVSVCGYKFINLSVAAIALMALFGTGRAVWIGIYLFASITAGLTVQKSLVAAGGYNASSQSYMGTASLAMEKIISIAAGGSQFLWCWILMPALSAGPVGTSVRPSDMFRPESTR